MGKFLNGLFIGFSIGLFIAPQAGEETRRMIMERVVTLRKRMLSEDEPHFSIDTHPPLAPPFPVQPAQPVKEFFGEPEVQGITSEPSDQPATAFFSEPEVQGITSEPSDQPATAFFSEPQVQSITSEPSDQPATAFFSEPQVQGITSEPSDQPATAFFSEPQVQGITSKLPVDTVSELSNQDANVTDNTSNIADTTQTVDSTNPGFVPDAHPDLQTPAETLGPDTAITEKLPPLSSPSGTPSRIAKRKASVRTPNTGKSRGHKFQS